jgi:NADP-dependent alcohol dehydrogenase
MLNFEYWNPTRVVFGKDQYERLPELLKEYNAKKVLLVFGGGSIKRIGLYDKLMSQLNDFEVIPFGGVEANPEYTTLMNAVEVARDQNIDFILAVGGGSVIDGVKFISGAIPYVGDPWDVMEKKVGCEFGRAIPFGTVLTLPATGSEVNSGAVVSRSEIKAKRVMGGPQFFPKFSFCDPTLVSSLPKRQLANGIIDAYTHTLEQYLTTEYGNWLQEREAEAILQTLIQVKQVVDEPGNYQLAYNLMLSSSHALNGNLRSGTVTDWATHMIGHELTALFGIDHARTLAIIAPRLYEHTFENKKAKLVQYGKRVLGLTGDDNTIAQNAITETESFFQSLGIDTRISAYSNDFDGCDKAIRKTFEERGWLEMGENGIIKPEDVEQIVASAF